MPFWGSMVFMRRGLWWTVAGIALSGLLVFAPFLYSMVTEASPPRPEGLAQPGEQVQVRVPATDSAVIPTGIWEVLPESRAGYRIKERSKVGTLVSLGRTSQVTGFVTTEDGVAVQMEVEFGIPSIASGDGVRDRTFARALEAQVYPRAIFTLTDTIDLNGVQEGAEPATVTVRGILTLHGQTRPVRASLELQRLGEYIEIRAAFSCRFADFGIGSMDRDGVRVASTGTLELQILLGGAASSPEGRSEDADRSAMRSPLVREVLGPRIS